MLEEEVTGYEDIVRGYEVNEMREVRGREWLWSYKKRSKGYWRRKKMKSEARQVRENKHNKNANAKK